MGSAEIDFAVSREIEGRLNELRGMDRSLLLRQKSDASQLCFVLGKPIEFTTYVEPVPDGRVFVAVRSDQRRFFGLLRSGETRAFWLLEDGSVVNATNTEVLDFFG